MLRPENVLVLSLITVGLVTLVFATVPVAPVSMACAVALGVPAVGWIASQQTLLQKSVADEFLGRVFGAFAATTALMLFVGSLASGALGDVAGIVPLLIGPARPVVAGWAAEGGARTPGKKRGPETEVPAL